MENSRQKFYYKLCVVYKGRIFNYMQRTFEFQIGQSLSQDLSKPSPYLYVYKTPELAVSAESNYTSKENQGVSYTKTIIKLMCWGDLIETPRKFAFSNMCVVENIGSQPQDSCVRATSKMRNTKHGSTRREISPRGIKTNRETSPARIYSSVVARKKSPIANNFIRNLRSKGKVNDLLRKMKEESDKIDNEVKEIENWNKFLDLEELEGINS